jgi:hypothetical protein
LDWKVAGINSAGDILVAKRIAFQDLPEMGQDQRHICKSLSGARGVWFCDPDGKGLLPTQV